MTYEEIIKTLKVQGNPKNVEGMARFGITAKNTLGIPIPFLRDLASAFVKTSADREKHKVASQLWDSGIHEARILASMIDVPELVTEAQMNKWAREFDSWDVCDQVCMNLFDKTPFAFQKAVEWSKEKEEFYKRAGFSLMACLAWHDKTSPDSKFLSFFPIIKREATDERNFVKKAVNWALRQMGKARPTLKAIAVKTAKEILELDSKTAKWIASDALRELEKPTPSKAGAGLTWD